MFKVIGSVILVNFHILKNQLRLDFNHGLLESVEISNIPDRKLTIHKIYCICGYRKEVELE